MTSRIISLQLYTDSKSLFDVITKFCNTERKRLIIGIQSVRKAYDLGKILNIGLVRPKCNPADSFDKVKANSVLQSIILHKCADFQVEKWACRFNETNNFCIPQMEEMWK